MCRGTKKMKDVQLTPEKYQVFLIEMRVQDVRYQKMCQNYPGAQSTFIFLSRAKIS